MTHKEFLAEVRKVATLGGYLSYTTHRSDRSPAGFPDLCMVRSDPPDFLMAELKVGRDKPSPAQEEWISTLEAANIEVYVWRPEHLDQIIARLARPRKSGRVYQP